MPSGVSSNGMVGTLVALLTVALSAYINIFPPFERAELRCPISSPSAELLSQQRQRSSDLPNPTRSESAQTIEFCKGSLCLFWCTTAPVYFCPAERKVLSDVETLASAMNAKFISDRPREMD